MTAHVQKPGTSWVAVAAALAAAAPATAEAADRALLVAAGGYQAPIPALPGMSRDLEAMTDVAHGLGFRDDGIRTLSGPQATRAAITEALETWLVEGVGPGDRALFYYSGHGTRVKDENGDEADGLDEALGQRGQRHGAAAGNEQLVVERVAQSSERAAHGRLTQMNPPAGVGDAPFPEQRVERDQKIQVESVQIHCGGHRSPLERRTP